MSITDVAAITGFSDPSYFARVFRKRLGAAPSVYREQALQQHAEELGKIPPVHVMSRKK
jgi:AraC-like DNA-binding protein